jgi:hypothetical protein
MGGGTDTCGSQRVQLTADAASYHTSGATVKIVAMKWMPLYALAALVTGVHNFYGQMNMVNGAPINLLNCISLLGSAMLLGTAFLLPFRPSFAARVGLAGSILSWVYYGPLIVASLVVPFSMWLEIKTFITFHDYVPLMGMLVGPVLLIACTVHSTLFVRHSRESRTAIRPPAN